MITRIVALILTLTLAMSMLTGCSPKKKAKENEVIVSIWQGFGSDEADLFKAIMGDYEKEWEKEHPGKDLVLKIDYVAFNDMSTKLKSAALAKITPDIAFMDSIKVTDLSFGKALVPVDTLEGFKKRYKSLDDARTQFVKASFDAGIVNRLGEVHLYGLPVQTTTVALFWNKAMFRQKAQLLRAAGLDPNRPPKTWDELIAYGKVLTDKDAQIYGYAMYNTLWFNFPILNMYGVDFVKVDEKGHLIPSLATPSGKAALDSITKLLESGVEGGGWKRGGLAPDTGFLNGKYAMVMTGPWKVQEYANAGLDFDVALNPAPSEAEVKALGLPAPEQDLISRFGQQAYSSSNVGGQTGVILRASENKEIAYELLEHFTNESVQRKWASTLGQIPVRKAAWKDLDTRKFPLIVRFMDQLEVARRIPQIPMFGTLETDIFNPEFDSFLKGVLKTDVTLKNLERSLDEKIFRRINDAADAERGG